MKKVMHCLIVLMMMLVASCQEHPRTCLPDRQVLFDYQHASPPDHEGLDSLGMADFFDHANIQ